MSRPSRSGADSPGRGPIAWMARNRVAANLLMLVLLIGGLIMAPQINKEVFPDAQLDVVTVRVPYPGASPEEVEQGVILAVEEAVRGLEGVKEVRSYADEGEGIVNVELTLSAERNEMLDEVEAAVQRITSFPEDAERPVVSLVTNRRNVISLIYYGEVGEHTLRELAEQARVDLLADPRVTFVELSGVRPLEIAIELSRDDLRRYGLTLGEVRQRMDAASIDLPAGDIETERDVVVLRTTEREETAEAFESVPLVSLPDGTQVRLGDVAEVRETFRDVDRAAFYDGTPAARVDVFRIGDETPLAVAAAAKQYARTQRVDLPPAVGVSIWSDFSEIYDDRMSLMLRNGYIGLGLVLLVIGLFLEPKLAFWVTLGIPISFLGALLLLPGFDVSINLISMFAFIVTLGLVVDDAIVVGEAVYRKRRAGVPLLGAAVDGAHEVARPVLFSIATTCIAFTPLLFVPGVAGQFFRNIPTVVILVLLVSLVEALLILPAHLSHRMPRLLGFVLWPFLWLMGRLRSDRVSDQLERFVQHAYRPFTRRCLEWRYTTVAVGLVALAVVSGLVMGNRLKTVFLPRIQDDEVRATVQMPVGTPMHVTDGVQRRLTAAARRVDEQHGEQALIEGVYADIGLLPQLDQASAAPPETGAHLATVQVDLPPAGERDISSRRFVEKWRKEMGPLPRAETLSYAYTIGATGAAPINVRLSHPRERELYDAASEIARALERIPGVRDIDEGFSRGKKRVDFRLTEEGRARGLTEQHLARELRGAFFGSEVQRFQRGRNEVRVYVRLPERQRRSLADLEKLVLRTPEGGEMSIGTAAELDWDDAYTRIQRTDMERTVNVTAHVDPAVVNANDVMTELSTAVLPRLEREYPELNHAPGGEQQTEREATGALRSGFALAVMGMFALLAVAFRSYLQPVLVLCAIPFGAIGAVLAHLLLGFDLSLSSLFGLIALSGVVVNDSLLLVVAINEERERHESLHEAAVNGGARRVRAILLTSLTTFFGLSPIIFETSVQARFLIPMAAALGFGVLLATPMLAFVVPALYLILEDVRRGLGRVADRVLGPLEGKEVTPKRSRGG